MGAPDTSFITSYHVTTYCITKLLQHVYISRSNKDTIKLLFLLVIALFKVQAKVTILKHMPIIMLYFNTQNSKQKYYLKQVVHCDWSRVNFSSQTL